MTHHRHDEADPVTEADREDTDERPRESYPNPTQQRIDEEGRSDAPADVSWEEERWGERPEEVRGDAVEAAEAWPETEDSPHEGEQGQQDAV